MRNNFRLVDGYYTHWDIVKDYDKHKMLHYITREENGERMNKTLAKGHFKMTKRTLSNSINVSESKAQRLITEFEKLNIITCIKKGSIKDKTPSIYRLNVVYYDNEKVNDMKNEPVYNPISEPIKSSKYKCLENRVEPINEPIVEPLKKENKKKIKRKSSKGMMEDINNEKRALEDFKTLIDKSESLKWKDVEWTNKDDYLAEIINKFKYNEEKAKKFILEEYKQEVIDHKLGSLSQLENDILTKARDKESLKINLKSYNLLLSDIELNKLYDIANGDMGVLTYAMYCSRDKKDIKNLYAYLKTCVQNAS